MEWRSTKREGEEGADVRRFWSCSLPPATPSPNLPCSGDKESHTCSSWQLPQGIFGSNTIRDFLKQFVTWEFMDF